MHLQHADQQPDGQFCDANITTIKHRRLLLQVSNMVSRELEKECVVVFDEAHNIDNVCIEVSHVPPSVTP